MKVMMLSSLSRESGGWLRTLYIGESLALAGAEIEWVQPFPRALLKSVDCLLTVPRYSLRALVSSAQVVIANKPLPNVLAAIKILQAKGVMSVLDMDDDDTAMVGPWAARILESCISPVVRHATLITTHNARLAEMLALRYGIESTRLLILPQGVSPRFFSDCPHIPDDPGVQQWQRQGCKLLLFMAHMNAASEMDVILTALEQAVARDATVRLVVVGGGVRLDEYILKARRRGLESICRFCGQVTVDDVPGYIHVANVCLLYYHDNRYNRVRESMKIREYLAMGKAVVCNAVGNLDAFRSYIYQSGNTTDDFSCTLVRLLTDASVRDGRETLGRNYVRQCLDWTRLGQMLALELSRRMKVT